ncbi:hypothetical protein D3C80_1067380 [compost metagenome]
MKVPITQVDHLTTSLEQCRVSIGKGGSGHALFMKVNDRSVTALTDTESLTRLRDELTKYLEEQ